MNVTRDGIVHPVPDLVRRPPDRDEVARAQERDRVLVRDALAVERLLQDVFDGGRGSASDRHAATSSRTNRSSGTCVELPDVARHLEERVQAGPLARPEAVAQLLEVAREEAGGIPVRVARLLREQLGLRAREPHRGDERVLELDKPFDDRLRRRPDGEDHRQPGLLEPEPAEVEVRRRILERAVERRVADEELRVGLHSRAAGSPPWGGGSRVSTTEVALSGVTATERTWAKGMRVTSWIESTAPSEETHSARQDPEPVGVPRVLDRRDRRDVDLALEQHPAELGRHARHLLDVAPRARRRRAPCSRTRSGRASSPPPRRRRTSHVTTRSHDQAAPEHDRRGRDHVDPDGTSPEAQTHRA